MPTPDEDDFVGDPTDEDSTASSDVDALDEVSTRRGRRGDERLGRDERLSGDERPSGDSGGGIRRQVLVALAALTLLIGTAVAAFQLGSATSRPPEASVDVGFARDMQTHHQQAVDLAMTQYARTTNPSVRSMAYDIATTQAQQAGQMYGWLRIWDYTQSAADDRMTWMRGHPGHPSDDNATRAEIWAAMGLADERTVADFKAMSGPASDRRFLEILIAHHKGGVLMGQAALTSATQPAVRQLAKAIVDSQTVEIHAMEALLATL